MNLLERIGLAAEGLLSPLPYAGIGRTTEDMPEWAIAFINQAFRLPERKLEHVDAFLVDPFINAAVTQLQDDVGKLELVVYQGVGDKRRRVERKRRGRVRVPYQATPEDLADLLHAVNPLRTWRELIADTVGSRTLNGNHVWKLQYGWDTGNAAKVPQEIWPLPGHNMSPVPGENRTIKGFEYLPERWGQPEFIPMRDVKNRPLLIHFKRFNPKDEPVGLGRLEALRSTYLGRYFALQWLQTFFQKGGVMAGIWKPGLPEKGGKQYSTEELEAWAKKLRLRTQGWDKVHDPVIVQNLEFVQRGMTLDQMKIDVQLKELRTEAMAALGIPPVMLGIKEGGGLSDAGAGVDMRNYHHGRVRGEADAIVAVINEQLCPLFGDDIEVELDDSSVLQIQADRLEQAKAHAGLVAQGLETPNEARRAIGLDPDAAPESDKLRVVQGGFGAGGAGGPGGPGAQGIEGDPQGVAASKRRLRLDAAPDPRDAMRTRQAATLDHYESRFLSLVRSRLSEQHAVARERLRARWVQEGGVAASKREAVKLAVDIGELMDAPSEEDRARVRRLLEQLLAERGQQAVADLETIVGAALEVDVHFNSQRAAAFLNGQMDRAINLPDETTRQALRGSLQEGLADGEGLGELVARVDQVFETRGNQALTIARSESTPAYNFASLEAWGQSGIVSSSEWVTSHDDLVRPAHAELDGQTAPMGESFLPDETLRFPGDPDAPPELSLNCRCGLNPVVDENAVAAAAAHAFDEWLAPATNGHSAAGANRLKKYFAKAGA